ncbi:phospholipase D family protein [Luteimonas sp. TWI1437]|uniref:phospholipase D family protein n=1 Tax=unclassified Luteimonas TaxID=2629088 RepID=UPI003209A500
MKTTIITDTKALFATLQTLTRTSSIIDLCVAWATSSKGQGRHWKALDLSKVRYAIVGTAFAQTEPAALEDLANKPGRLRLMINSHGTFHPKVIIGRHGDQVRSILGSANFTTAAYTGNTELSVLLEGTDSDPELQAIEAYVREQWQRGTELTKEWLDEYALTWKAAKRQRILVPRAKLEVDSLTDLEMPWSTYVELIRKQQGRKLSNGTPIRVTGASPSYMEELRLTQAVFRSESRFENLSKDQRNLLMGVGARSSGFLGSMKPAGYARGLVRSEPERIGKSLDRLPLDGPVSLSEVARLLNELTQLKGLKIGVATRFFAVKRPDLFVSVNKGSNPQLAKFISGGEVKTVKQYIGLLEAIWFTEWHRSPRPTDAGESALWECRAALLDAALYESV